MINKRVSNELTVSYEGNLHAVAKIMPVGCSVAMDAPAKYGGSGKSFCPLDLFALSYAGCMVISMDQTARQNGFNIAGTKVKVSLVMTRSNDFHMDEIEAKVVLPRHYTEGQIDVLRKAVGYCPIHNSLRPGIKTTLVFVAEPDPKEEQKNGQKKREDLRFTE